jgi:predicted DNA repair protein MutK
MEKEKVKGAVRTDFILSAEIIVIALGTVAAATFLQQVTVLVGIAVVMTIGVYGLVGAIVKMDDAGLYLSKRAGAGVQAFGRFLLNAAPKLMKFLSVAGHAAEAVGSVGGVGPLLAAVTPSVLDAIGGVIAGAIVLAVVTIGSKLLSAVKR